MELSIQEFRNELKLGEEKALRCLSDNGCLRYMDFGPHTNIMAPTPYMRGWNKCMDKLYTLGLIEYELREGTKVYYKAVNSQDYLNFD